MSESHLFVCSTLPVEGSKRNRQLSNNIFNNTQADLRMPPIFDVDDTTLLFFESLTRAKHSATCFAHFGSFLGRGYYYVIFKMLLQRVAQCPVGEEQICGYRYLEAVETGGRWVPHKRNL